MMSEIAPGRGQEDVVKEGNTGFHIGNFTSIPADNTSGFTSGRTDPTANTSGATAPCVTKVITTTSGVTAPLNEPTDKPNGINAGPKSIVLQTVIPTMENT
ncbi:hypothetical protein Tco_0836952 [Tanacetum coccineum]